uniref:Uncharacterized protein n=1 Tax=Anguilla anguilla TaxID=7936 RepID=A0A0E9PUK9_ANGAN
MGQCDMHCTWTKIICNLMTKISTFDYFKKGRVSLFRLQLVYVKYNIL